MNKHPMMKHKILKHLHQLRSISRKKHHHLLHHLHKKHKFSKKTLFYVKEYGPHSHVARTIIKESAKILLFASIISSFGGLAIEHIKVLFISIIPLIILMPALNDMIGDYGTIISSKFSTLLYEGRVGNDWRTNKELKKMFLQIMTIALIMASISGVISLIISKFFGYDLSLATIIKVLLIAILDVGILVTILFLIAIVAGLYFYNKQEDPNNFLIPITTSVADFGNMILLAFLVLILF